MSDFNIQIDTSDLDEKVGALVELSSKNMAMIYRRSMSKSAIQTVVKAARRDLKSILSTSEDSTGETAKSLGVKNARRKAVTMLGAKTDGKYNGQLIHILEQGTQNRRTKKGYNRGAVMGLQFYQQAFTSNKSNLINKFDDNLRENYIKYIEKQINK